MFAGRRQVKLPGHSPHRPAGHGKGSRHAPSGWQVSGQAVQTDPLLNYTYSLLYHAQHPPPRLPISTSSQKADGDA